MPSNKNDVCMRLVEYSKNGQAFRKWTFERLGEKVDSGEFDQCLHQVSNKAKAAEYDGSSRRSYKGPRATSPLARRLKQQRVQREENMLMEEEEAERRRQQRGRPKKEKAEFEKRFDKFDRLKADSYNDIKYQENTVDIKTAREPLNDSADLDKKRKKKEKSDLQIDERMALKEMSKLYRDLLERFEELRLKQESQMNAEADSTRLRRLAKADPSVNDTLHDAIEAVKKALHDFKTCANLAGSLLPNSEFHERELSHILLELECTTVHK